MQNKTLYSIALMRICLGFMFLWGFLDKVIGLGFNTAQGKAWIDGVSPTFGYLKFGVTGPLTQFYQGLAGNPLIDLIFMTGLLAMGLSLILGICTRCGSIAGIIFMAIVYTTAIPLEFNPIIDEHIIELIGLLIVLFASENQKLDVRSLFAKKV